MKHDAYIGIDPSFSRSGIAFWRNGIVTVRRVETKFKGPGFVGSLDSAVEVLEGISKALSSLKSCESIGLAIEFPPPTHEGRGPRKSGGGIRMAAPLFGLDSILSRELPQALPITEIAFIPTAKCRYLAQARSGTKGKTDINNYAYDLTTRISIRNFYFLGTPSARSMCHDEAEGLLMMLYLMRRDDGWVYRGAEDRAEAKRWEWRGEECRSPRRDWGFASEEEGDRQEGHEEDRHEEEGE